MKFKTEIFLFLLLSFIACKEPIKKEAVTTAKTEILPSQKVPNSTTNWITAINSGDISRIERNYMSNAIKVVSTDSILESASQITNYYQNKKTKIAAIESLFTVEANKEKQIHYELISYKTEKLEEYIEIVIWKLVNGKAIRDFEFTEKSNPEAKNINTKEIDQARKLWIKLCNENNADKLVKQLYSSDAIYYNHKPIVKGVKDLIKEYDYMNNTDYSLKLEPLNLQVVNGNYAFEIGQCSGSYNGNYILVWKKQADGNWKIEIDSNI